MSDKTQQLLNQDISFEKIDNFLEIFNDFKNLQQQQKMRGLNDFNIFTTVLKKHDEVRLHSRFLAFLLNPNANHYQGDLFLDLFLQQIGLNGFFDNLSNCSVRAEYQNIDIYITDGNKHIIIENKIWAGDQHAQVKRYIETINEENENLDNANLVVMYLSLDREEPSRYSLCHNKIENDEANTKENCPDGFYINNKQIIGRGKNKDKTYQFINLNYNNDIKKWLKKSHKEVANITNLSVGITQYQEVIQKIYGKHKERVMSLECYLNNDKNKENKVDLIKTMKSITQDFEKYRKNSIERFFVDVVGKLKNEISLISNWELKLIEKGITSKRYTLPLYFYHTSYEVGIGVVFDFDSNDYHNPYFSIKRIDGEKHNLEDRLNLKKIKAPKRLTKDTVHSIKYDYYFKGKGDMFDEIIKDGSDDKFVTEFMEVFKEYKDFVVKCNEVLSNER